MRLPTRCPVLARPALGGGIDVQVGLARPVILSGLGLSERAFVASLEGGRPVTPSQARRFARVVGLLAAGGAWEELAGPRVAVAVGVHGAGAVGMDVAMMLVRAGFDVALHDAAPMAVEPAGTYHEAASGTCAGAGATTLARKGIRVRVGGGGEALQIVICAGAPDPPLVTAWTGSDVPHMLAVCDGDSVWVSHVIVPGITACSRCRDVAATLRDPAWPQLALQLGGSTLPSRRAAAPPLACTTAAARVAARAAAWVAREEAGCGERALADGGLLREPLLPERGCGCGAAGPVGDELAARRAAWPGVPG